MATNSTTVTDNHIRAAAIAQGFVDASVDQHTSRGQKEALDKGIWFVLSVKRNVGDDWDVLGMRRTVPELLSVLHNHQARTN